MKRNGFTAMEMMLASGIFALVMAGTFSVVFVSNRSWFSADIQVRCMREADMVLQRMVYGAHGTNGLRSAISTNVSVSISNTQWSVTYSTPDGAGYNYTYIPSGQIITHSDLSLSNVLTVGENIESSVLNPVTNGLSITIQVALKDGRFAATNVLTTFVRYRN